MSFNEFSQNNILCLLLFTLPIPASDQFNITTLMEKPTFLRLPQNISRSRPHKYLKFQRTFLYLSLQDPSDSLLCTHPSQGYNINIRSTAANPHPGLSKLPTPGIHSFSSCRYLPSMIHWLVVSADQVFGFCRPWYWMLIGYPEQNFHTAEHAGSDKTLAYLCLLYSK